ncbi:MAG: hypothetical protein V2A71_10465 [Candidatus Eisenbacteria bacterium]
MYYPGYVISCAGKLVGYSLRRRVAVRRARQAATAIKCRAVVTVDWPVYRGIVAVVKPGK